jgi:hypothetical protein
MTTECSKEFIAAPTFSSILNSASLSSEESEPDASKEGRQLDQGLWIYTTRQRRQGCLRAHFGRGAGLRSLNEGAEVRRPQRSPCAKAISAPHYPAALEQNDTPRRTVKGFRALPKIGICLMH